MRHAARAAIVGFMVMCSGAASGEVHSGRPLTVENGAEKPAMCSCKRLSPKPCKPVR